MCPGGKVGYPNQTAADDALTRIGGPDSNHRRHSAPPTSSYQCGLCGAWHLTSSAQVR